MAENREFLTADFILCLESSHRIVFNPALCREPFCHPWSRGFNQAAHFMEQLPFRYFLEIFIIFLPILFHAIYGLFIVFQGKANTKRFGYYRNWMFLLQRITGVFYLSLLPGTYGKRELQLCLGKQ